MDRSYNSCSEKNILTGSSSPETFPLRRSLIESDAHSGKAYSHSTSAATTNYITFKAVITIAIRLRYDYDPTTMYRARLLPFDAIRREQKTNMSIFCRSRVVIVSQLNRTQIVISITSVVVECVVISSYRNRTVVESQL